MLGSIRDSRAKSLAGVPDSLIEKERDIKIQLAYSKNSLYQAQKNKENGKLAVLEKSIFDIQQQYDQLKRKLEDQFPGYYHLRYNYPKPDLNRLSESLDDETGIVEFFMGDTALYKITVTKAFSSFESIPRNTRFAELLKAYEKSLTDASFILNSPADADALYTRSAYGLYGLLLRSSLGTEANGVKKLVLIPDDILAQFNFSTLLSKESGEKIDYKALSYLTKDYRISYAYSAMFLLEIPTRAKKKTESFAGFAPSYERNQFADIDSAEHLMTYLVVRSGNLPLPGAEQEVKLITQFMDGKAWLKADATETNFKQYAGDYSILHLAMHSLLNNDNPDYSELLFNRQQDEFNDGFLNVSEIYNLNLNAQMIVLSACSSGYGKIQAGEGPISISRAFSYAGCSSIVMTLWKIPDAVTSRIMTTFYQELKNGKPKDESLRLAQIKFLNENDDPLYRHPYFWAGFVVIGDVSSLSTGLPDWAMYSGIFVLLMLIAFLIIKSRGRFNPTPSKAEVPTHV